MTHNLWLFICQYIFKLSYEYVFLDKEEVNKYGSITTQINMLVNDVIINNQSYSSRILLYIHH